MAKTLMLDNRNKVRNGVAKLFDVNNSNSKFSDIKVKVGERVYFCHKFVLQLNSDHFHEQSLAEETIILEKVESNDFQDVLQFMYTGEILLCISNIESILSATDVLQMNDLKSICFQFLVTIRECDAMYCLHLANKYKRVELGTKCLADVIKDFRKLQSTESLVHASAEIMTLVLRADNLNVDCEVTACETLLKWLNLTRRAGKETSPEELLQLLQLIRWSAISEEYIRNKLLPNTILASTPDCITFLSKVLEYLVTGIQFPHLLTFHRPSTGLENCLLVLGIGETDGKSLDNKMSQEVCKITLQKPNTVSVLHFMHAIKLRQRACATGKNTIYLTGPGTSALSNEMTKFEVLSLNSQKCANMVTERRCHHMVAIDSMVYVLGGKQAQDGSCLAGVECYNTLRNQWNAAGDLVHAVSNAACVVYKKFIYLFGGLGCEKHAVDCVQVYNPADKTCKVLDQKMPQQSDSMRAVLWETSVILINTNNCLVYNFETQTWLERQQYKAEWKNFGLIVENQMVYLIGGRMDIMTKIPEFGFGTAAQINPQQANQVKGATFGTNTSLSGTAAQINPQQQAKQVRGPTFGTNTPLFATPATTTSIEVETWQCTSDVKRVPVINILENLGDTWEKHGSLSKELWLSEYVSMTLPSAQESAAS